MVVFATLLSGCLLAPPPGTSSSPSGYVDLVTGGEGSVRIAGWTSDWDTLKPIRVMFLVNGTWYPAVFTANKPRPDVAAAFGRGANFGFDETIPVPAGPVMVCVSALNFGPGDNTLLGCAATTVLEPTIRTVANNGDVLPGTTATFNSYNQPAVNSAGLVTFRARARGSEGRGVFAGDPRKPGAPLQAISTVGSLVPQPNNLGGTFNEFPSTPRIDRDGSMIATRGQSTPVWTYTPAGGVETRVGTSGIYATTTGGLAPAATLLGSVPGFQQFAVPDVTPSTRFDQFPGSPAVDGSTVVFKGNYTAGSLAQTGVFFRDMRSATNPTQVIASSQTRIPNQPDVGGKPGTVTFGSTAPPSAAGGKVVFTGLDNEDAPTLGGVYLAPLSSHPTLTPIVSIGEQVPGMAPSDTFNSLGEGLSFDGRFVTFWGAWGPTTDVTLTCPTDGNADLLNYCNTTYPDGFVAHVPVHQGIFVHDSVTHTTRAVALADASDPSAEFANFQYWTFSGRPPTGTGDDGSQELPRWRASAFAAVSGKGADYRAAFKATKANGTTGIYLAKGPAPTPTITVVDTATPGSTIDPEAPAGTNVTSVGIERDGFRGQYLAISVGMANQDASVTWGGIYLIIADQLKATTVVPTPNVNGQTVGPLPPHSRVEGAE